MFDYLFLTAIGLDWLLLGLIIFGNKTLLFPLPENKKNIFKNSLFNIVLILLLLVFMVKILLTVFIAIPLNNMIASEDLGEIFFLFIFFQLLFSFVFLFLGLLLFVKNGFKEDFQPIWTRHIVSFLIFSLFADSFTGLALYLLFIVRLFPADLKTGALAIAYRPLTASHYWLALGLVLSLVVYFIFYLALKSRNTSTTVTGMSLSYTIIIIFGSVLVYYYRWLIAPDTRFLLNNLNLYLALTIWLTVLFLGIGSLLSIVFLFRKQKFLKNDFYFHYILIRLSGFHAVNVAAFVFITLVPILFFALYR